VEAADEAAPALQTRHSFCSFATIPTVRAIPRSARITVGLSAPISLPAHMQATSR
jgi:hypothetical protein